MPSPVMVDDLCSRSMPLLHEKAAKVEDCDEFGPEDLALAFFVGFTFPAGGELEGVVLDGGPAWALHACSPCWERL